MTTAADRTSRALVALVLSSSEGLRDARDRLDKLSDLASTCGLGPVREELDRLGVWGADRLNVLSAVRLAVA